MLGYTLPLFLVAGFESALGLLLLCPKPLNQPAIRLARASYTQVHPPAARASTAQTDAAAAAGGLPACAAAWPCNALHAPVVLSPPARPPAPCGLTQVGATVFHTVAGVLALLLVSPLYDGFRLYRGTQQAANPEAASLDMG